MRTSRILTIILAPLVLSLPACMRHGDNEEHEEQHEILVTTPMLSDETITQPYVCQIHAQKHIEVKALEEGYLLAINLKEGQPVTEGQVLFSVNPAIYKAIWDAELAEADVAYIEWYNTERLSNAQRPVVSKQEVALYEAKLKRARAKAAQAGVEYEFTFVKAPFTGIIDRLLKQQGSLVKKDEVLTTLSDNSTMWVYFNVPEARYLEFKAREAELPPKERSKDDNTSRLTLANSSIELVLADGSTFAYDVPDPKNPTKKKTLNVVTIEGTFNNETGNIAFRADYPNPNLLLRHGQTGTIKVHRKLSKALVIPQRATFEILDKRYVFVVDANNVVHQRPITIDQELEDIFVIRSGLSLEDTIILEGIREVHDGVKLEEFKRLKPEDVMKDQKTHAE